MATSNDQRTFQNIVDGERVDAASGAPEDVLDPGTGEVYAPAPASGAEDVGGAYAAAATAFESWGRTTPKERSEGLWGTADAIGARGEEITAVEVRDPGKPIGLT